MWMRACICLCACVHVSIVFVNAQLSKVRMFVYGTQKQSKHCLHFTDYNPRFSHHTTHHTATETIQLDSVFFKQTKKHSFNFCCLKKRSDSLLFSLIIPWTYVVACSEVYKIDESLCESCGSGST